ncbi:hypothetical protein Sjap_023660 [Stephania japonica]|uniref:Bet v I/Major latex protein domain-containing protein n=1 Tax=Stephania japonica TaxID=461633 RepID=A0AAP0EH99_9MAGN
MASSSGKLEVDVEVKSPPEKFWEAFKDSVTLFPKLLSDEYKSIEVVEGDGKSVGTVKLIKYVEGLSFITFSKEKVVEFDEEKKVIAYEVIDGELLKYYKNFKATAKVSPKADGGSLVTWTCEFEKTADEVPDPTVLHDFSIKTFKELDAYLLKE